MDIELLDEQKDLLTSLKYWYHHYKTLKPYYSYSGAAGVGKTTVIKAFIEDLGLKYDEVISAAYVGKAVLVLLQHDLKASTIHSLIYNTVTESIETGEIDKNGDPKKKIVMRHYLKPSLDPEIKLIVIDEASMVNDDLKDKILSFGIPTVFIGDMNQLPPIFGSSTVMDHPDFILTKIMRQKENDPIIMLSQRVLHDQPLLLGEYGKSKIVPYYNCDRSMIDDFDITICAKNITRDILIKKMRNDILGITSTLPVIGDKMICRQNNWNKELNGFFLTNGTIGTILDIDTSTLHKGCISICFKPDFLNAAFENVDLDMNYLNLDYKEKANYGMSRFNKFEYAYCISAYLSQGGSFNDELFFDEPFWNRETTKKLQYTAITRAVDSITIVKSMYNPRQY